MGRVKAIERACGARSGDRVDAGCWRFSTAKCNSQPLITKLLGLLRHACFRCGIQFADVHVTHILGTRAAESSGKGKVGKLVTDQNYWEISCRNGERADAAVRHTGHVKSASLDFVVGEHLGQELAKEAGPPSKNSSPSGAAVAITR